MATADDYANWIVSNQDKQGTPEFNVVAQAYREAKAQESDDQPQPVAEPQRPPMTLQQQLVAPIAGAGYGVGRMGAGFERLVGKGMERVGLTETGQAVQRHAQAGRERIEREFEPYSQSLGGQVGAVAGEIGASLPVGGALTLPFKAAASYGPAVARPAMDIAAKSLSTSGFGVPKATTTAQKVLYPAARVAGGATVGGVTGEALEEGQGGLGATIGGAVGASSPLLMRMFQPAARFTRQSQPEIIAGATTAADDALRQVAQETGTNVNNIDPAFAQFIRDQAANAFRQGKKLDAAALVRSEEFKKLGMPYLQGQITRDPNAFAMERNLRGTQAGTPIREVLQRQNVRLHDLFGKPAAEAGEATIGGEKIMRTLAQQDEAARSAISAEYRLARTSAGKDLELPLQGLSQDYARVLDEYGDLVPGGVRNQFDKYGLAGSTQKKLYTMEEADKLLKVINQNSSNNPAINSALRELRNAVKQSVLDVDATGGPYAKAVKMARDRFASLEKNPAMAAVYEGRAIPDDFVRKYIVNGKTNDVKALADALRKDPDVFSQAKSQMADDIRRAAFGEDLASDAPVSPERLAKKLREFGTQKMGAFFSPEEIANYELAAKVATYVEKHPNAAAVNTSNTLVAQLMTNPALVGVAKVAGKIPGAQSTIEATKAIYTPIKQGLAVSKAVKPNVPMEKLPLTEPQRKLLSAVLGKTSGAVAGQLAEQGK